MLTGLDGNERQPTFALMVTDDNDRRGTAMWSDPEEKKVTDVAKYLNEKERKRGRRPRYRVEKRFPVSLAMVFSGDGSAYSEVLARRQAGRNNGC